MLVFKIIQALWHVLPLFIELLQHIMAVQKAQVLRKDVEKIRAEFRDRLARLPSSERLRDDGFKRD